MGSSPAMTPKKNRIGRGPGTSGISGDSQRNSRGIPGTSAPTRLTISWNIMGVVALFDRFMHAIPVLRGSRWAPRTSSSSGRGRGSTRTAGHLGDVGLPPLTDRDLLVHRLRPVPGMPAERIGLRQDPALVAGVTANSRSSQSMSVYGLKFRRTEPSDRAASVSTYAASSDLHVAPPAPDHSGSRHEQPPRDLALGCSMSKRYRRYRVLSIPLSGFAGRRFLLPGPRILEVWGHGCPDPAGSRFPPT